MEEKLTNLNASKVSKIVSSALEVSKKRNFKQTIEVGVNLTGISFKQPQNRIGLEVEIPNPFKKKPKTLLFGKEKNTVEVLKKSFDKVIMADDIPNIDKKEAKKLARDYGLFFAEPQAMAIVGKHLGQILAPRGKMPKPAPANPQVVEGLIAKTLRTVVISNKKGKNLPTIHFAIGKEEQDAKSVADNFMVCYNKLIDALPGKIQNVKSIYIKATMGAPQFLYRK